MSLQDLRATFHKWFDYKDETFLDLCIAVGCHTQLLRHYDLAPLWIFCIKPSGAGGSETLRAFYDGDVETIKMNHITPNTLASGMSKKVKFDLAPKLDRKLVLTYDFGQFLKMEQTAKSAVYSQLRSAYDGEVIRDTGSGVHTAYTGLKWNWIVASTPAIDEELIIRDQLGTRELIYRLPDEQSTNEENNELMDKVWDNSDVKEQMRQELKSAVLDYMREWKKRNYIEEWKQPIPDSVKDTIFIYAQFITVLRATAETDQKSELTNFVYPEKPTRILEQLKGLYQALRLIGLSDEECLQDLKKVTLSSIHPIRLKILLEITKCQKLHTTQIQRNVGIGWFTTYRELNILHALGLIECEIIEEDNTTVKVWSVTEQSDLIKFVQQINPKEESTSTIKHSVNVTIKSEPSKCMKCNQELKNYYEVQLGMCLNCINKGETN